MAWEARLGLKQACIRSSGLPRIGEMAWEARLGLKPCVIS